MSTPAITPQKMLALQARMEQLKIAETDLEERFIRGGGAGGQKINKTSSTVVLVHKPTGLEVRSASSRSQALNRFLARRELCEKVAEKILGEKSARQQEREKIRRQKRRKSSRQIAKMVDDKKHHGRIKRLRQKPAED